MTKENSSIPYAPGYYNQFVEPKKCETDAFKNLALPGQGKLKVDFTNPFGCSKNQKEVKK